MAAEAGAQTVPQQPTPPTREEIERPAPPRTELPRAQLTVEGGIERAPCALERPEFQNIRFTPTAVDFADLRGLSPEDLRPAYAEFLGREQPVSVICEIRDRAATILRVAGYVASVEVPEQRIAEGNIRFQVLMAKLVGVRVRGDASGAESAIASYLNRLTEEEVFNRFTAERYLLLAGDLPGYNVRLSLRSAGQARGEVVGEVTVLRTPVYVDANIQNLGSRELGRWGAMLRGQFFGLTGLGDRTTLTAFSTLDVDEQQTLQLAHDFRVGSEGLSFAGQFTYAVARPDIDDFDIKSRTLFGTLEASYPFIRTQAENLRGGVGIDIVDQKVEFEGLSLTRDKLRVAFLRFAGDAVDTSTASGAFSLSEPRWRAGFDLELRQGLNILDASPDCLDDLSQCVGTNRVPPSRLDGDPTATVLRAGAHGEYRPVPRLTFSLAARGQYAKTALYSFEEFSAGNYSVGRGYDPGSLAGDRGVGFQAEVRAGSLVPRTRTSLAAEPYVFVDQAFVWNENRFGGPEPREELTSIGGGVRASLGDRLRIDASVAFPQDRIGPLNEKPDPRFLLSVTTRLWPWSLR